MIKIFELSMRDPLTAQIQCFLEQYPEWSVGKIDYFSYTQARVHFIKSQGHDCNFGTSYLGALRYYAGSFAISDCIAFWTFSRPWLSILSQDYFAICDFYCVEIIYILDEDCFGAFSMLKKIGSLNQAFDFSF